MTGVLYSAVCAKCQSHTGYSHAPVGSDFVCSSCIAGRAAPKPLTPRMTKAAKRRVERLSNAPKPLVHDFVPSGRSGLFIYAVVVKRHPDKVKIGMTRKWKNRRVAYANWDLSPGDAILDERVFCINEEFVDLEKLEGHILRTFDAPLAFGTEWFKADIDQACRHIDRIMCANGISYDM